MKLPDWCDPETVREVAKLIEEYAMSEVLLHTALLMRIAKRLRDRARRLERRQRANAEANPEIVADLRKLRAALEKTGVKKLSAFGIEVPPGVLIDTGSFTRASDGDCIDPKDGKTKRVAAQPRRKQ